MQSVFGEEEKNPRRRSKMLILSSNKNKVSDRRSFIRTQEFDETWGEDEFLWVNKPESCKISSHSLTLVHTARAVRYDRREGKSSLLCWTATSDWWHTKVGMFRDKELASGSHSRRRLPSMFLVRRKMGILNWYEYLNLQGHEAFFVARCVKAIPSLMIFSKLSERTRRWSNWQIHSLTLST